MTDFPRAEEIARTLEGVTKVSTTSSAVYAHGPDVWVCPDCLTTQKPGPPLGTDVCSCGRILCP